MTLAPGVLVVCGPTASGKSALAIELAERFDAEIVGADSRQIYRDMPVGTAAPTPHERSRVRHHLVEFLDPRERYSAAAFARDAMAAILDITARGRRAIVVGGSGFYLRALAGDVTLDAVRDEATRERLSREARLHPPDALHAWLCARDPSRGAALAPGDRYRVLRALEIALARAVDAPLAPAVPSLRAAGIACLKIALDVPSDVLAARVAARTDAMLRDGFLEEAERIGADAIAGDAVGYPQALAHLAGFSTERELRTALVRATLRYAKRQRTWLRSEPGVRWLPPGEVAQAAIDGLGWRMPGRAM